MITRPPPSAIGGALLLALIVFAVGWSVLRSVRGMAREARVYRRGLAFLKRLEELSDKCKREEQLTSEEAFELARLMAWATVEHERMCDCDDAKDHRTIRVP